MAEAQEVSRRNFMKAAGAVTAAAAALPKTQAKAASFVRKINAANNQVQFGMIGTGGRGQYLLKSFNTLDNGRCVAVCDIYEPHLKWACRRRKTTRRATKITANCSPARTSMRCCDRCRFTCTSRSPRTR